jgi:hypothetical protein
MTRTLGVSCTNKFAFLAVVENGEVLERGPVRIGAARSTDKDKALWETLDTLKTTIREIAPTRIALLLPGTGEHSKQTHSMMAPRIELETLMRMAAAQIGLPVNPLTRATVRARLGVTNKGSFDDAVRPAIAESGPYWTAGRLGAAAAAIAGSGG